MTLRSRGGLGPAVHGCRPRARRRSCPHRAVGRQRTLEGRVRLVEPSGFMKVSALGVEEQRVNVVIDFAGETGAGNLGDGYRVEVLS